MKIITVIGLLAGVVTTLSQAPQLIKILKTKSVDDISIGMYLMLFTGGSLWTIYGVFLGAAPIILANVVMLIFISTVLFFKIKYKKEEA